MKRDNTLHGSTPNLYTGAIVFFVLVCLFTLHSCTSFPLKDNLYEQRLLALNATANNTLPPRESTDSINGSFPEHIAIKTLTQTILTEGEFTLHEGLIYVKYNGSPTWELFMGTGLPHGNGCAPSSYITEISGDTDTLYAFDSNGKHYYIYLNPKRKKDYKVWHDVAGWPGKTPVAQSDLIISKRGWALSARREFIGYYEDPDEKQHYCGVKGIVTMYVLSENGQEIRFLDPGTAADFSRTIQGPENGTFVAENISASCSTLFLIGDDGTMYTRLIDFDSMGCDTVLMPYTYKTGKNKGYPGRKLVSGFDYWFLPNEPWKKENAIPLGGKARLTKYISITPTGYGNAARELRVAGTDANGTTGYYHKGLSEAEWQFEPYALNLSEDAFLTGEHRRGAVTHPVLAGSLERSGKTDTTVSITCNDLEFHSEGNISLNFTMATPLWSESKTVSFHIVEKWTHLMRYNPANDGHAKLFFATLTTEQEALVAEHGELTALLQALFKDATLDAFRYDIDTARDYLHFTGRDSRKKPFSIFLTKDKGGSAPVPQPVFSPQEAKLGFAYRNYITQDLDAPQLVLPYKAEYTPKDTDEITACMEQNRLYKKYLNDGIGASKHNVKRVKSLKTLVGTGNVIGTITLIKFIPYPKLAVILKTIQSTLNTTIDIQADERDFQKETVPYLESLVDARIASCERLLAAIERDGHAAGDTALCHSYADYFVAVELPLSTQGDCPAAPATATLTQLPNQPLMPVLLLSVGTASSAASTASGTALGCSASVDTASPAASAASADWFAIELQDAAPALYQAARRAQSTSTRLPNAANAQAASLKTEPLVLPARVIPLDYNPHTTKELFGVKNVDKKNATLTWDGETITITIENGRKTTVLFTGR